MNIFTLKENSLLDQLKNQVDNLHQIHQNGYIHGDVKLRNFLTTSSSWGTDSQLVLCDFDYTQRMRWNPAVGCISYFPWDSCQKAGWCIPSSDYWGMAQVCLQTFQTLCNADWPAKLEVPNCYFKNITCYYKGTALGNDEPMTKAFIQFFTYLNQLKIESYYLKVCLDRLASQIQDDKLQTKGFEGLIKNVWDEYITNTDCPYSPEVLKSLISSLQAAIPPDYDDSQFKIIIEYSK
jgi:Protein kinase domain.